MQRFFLPIDCFDESDVSITDPDLIHQLTRVLRMKSGDKIMLLDGIGSQFLTELTEFRKDKIKGKVSERSGVKSEPKIFITLYQAIPKKPALFEEILQHGTEIGVSRFVPIISERTAVQNIRNNERSARILREAAEQSERGIVPDLTEAVQLLALVKNPPSGLNLIADSYCTEPLLSELLPRSKKETILNIFVGPEGGFSKVEIEGLKKVGFQNFSLGKRILRTETAGVAICSTILLS